MEHVLLVVQVLLGIALVGIILLQRSDTDGFGLGSGSGMNMLSGRATANLLTRATAVLATLFIMNSLGLSIIAARGGNSSIVEEIQQQESATVPAVPVGTEQKAPVAQPTPVEKKSAPAVPAAQ